MWDLPFLQMETGTLIFIISQLLSVSASLTLSPTSYTMSSIMVLPSSCTGTICRGACITVVPSIDQTAA